MLMPLPQLHSSNGIHKPVESVGHLFFEESKDINLLQGSRIYGSSCQFETFKVLPLLQLAAMVFPNVSVRLGMVTWKT